MKECYCCNIALPKDDIALCRKLLGKTTECFFCREHLAEKLKISVEILDAKVEQYKEEGCTLFL